VAALVRVPVAALVPALLSVLALALNLVLGQDLVLGLAALVSLILQPSRRSFPGACGLSAPVVASGPALQERP
jgi:hypothetical protein